MVVRLPGYTDHGFFIQFHLFSRGVILVPPKRNKLPVSRLIRVVHLSDWDSKCFKIDSCKKASLSSWVPKNSSKTDQPFCWTMLGKSCWKKTINNKITSSWLLKKKFHIYKPRNNHTQFYIYITKKTCKSDITDIIIHIFSATNFSRFHLEPSRLTTAFPKKTPRLLGVDHASRLRRRT